MKPYTPSEVARMFNELSVRYDFFNDLFSFGLHRHWKRRLLEILSPNPGEKWVDLCCGTGGLTIEIGLLVEPEGHVVGIDYAKSQLELALKKVELREHLPISFIEENVLQSKLSKGYYDGVVMAYGLRNVESPLLALKEIYRLLNNGGRAGILDFSHLNQGTVAVNFQKAYLRYFVVPIASLFGFGEHFSYIEESLRYFPNAQLQLEMAKDLGFSKVRYINLAGGQMGILTMEKE